ncbi:MAG: excinuclease ABC subunit UvrC [Clostridiales bacterium]|jgi:excinuclease ABC subunit C|nr:excinuclease ABC subunit UvrC [Clostridiales bacterium]
MNEIIKEKLALLLNAPGVYKMIDKAGTVIYVGKAVSLKNRVRSYFQANKSHDPKVAAMVAHIADFETLLTYNETEALTLESNLIKKFKPRYNILLKDDKHFPYIRVDMRQDYPRFEVVRRVNKDGARYLGPYLSGVALREALNVVREHFPMRHCKKDIGKAVARRERPCLMYHVGKCCAPCAGGVSREEYHALIGQVITFLEGHTESVVKELTAQMQRASDDLEFERAARIRDRITAVSAIAERQAAIANKGVEQDVFACCALDEETLVFAVFVRGGKVVGTESFRIENAAGESGQDMAAFLKQYYNGVIEIPPEVALYAPAAEAEEIEAWLCDLCKKRVRMHVPQRGEKRRLTELAYRNGMDTLQKEQSLKRRAWEHGEGALAMLSGALGLEELPARMECFDNSHIQGRDTVSSMVVFLNGAPARDCYRRFRIQAPTEGDDYAAMEEALTRRFRRAADGDERFGDLPDLLVVDGGRGQLNVALAVLRGFGLEYIPVIGLAELSGSVYVPDSEEPLDLPRNGPAMHLLERLRDEAHRFAITYHRSLRGKNTLHSRLDEIPGVGQKRKRALFDAFPALDMIRAAGVNELIEKAGVDKRTAQAVYAYFHEEGTHT